MRLALVPLCLVISAAAWPGVITVKSNNSAAIKAAIETSQAGDEVRLPVGNYTISETVAPKSGTKLTGAGQGRTILKFTGDKGCGLIMLNGVEDVTVWDLTLDGANSPLVPVGIGAYDSRRLTIQRVTIRNLAKSTYGAHGIHFNGEAPTRQHGVTDSLIADCTIESIAPDYEWGAGIRCSWGSSRNRIEGCRIHNTGRGGIFGDNGSTDLIIRNNAVTGSHGEKLGIEVWGGCNRCIIEDNRIDHWLSIGGSDWCATRRNVISCQEDNCFGFIGIEAIGSYLNFTDNLVDDGQIIGLSVSNTNDKRYHYYARDTYRRCSQWAVQIQGEGPGATHYYYENCRFDGTTVGRGRVIYPGDDGNGFRINYGVARYLTFEGCSMSGNGRHGIQTTVAGGADWLSFIRCRIEDNQGAAMATAGGFTGLEWKDCVVTGNASNGLPAAVPMPAPPRAGFTGPTRARVRQTVQFRSTATANAGELRKTMWDLGDGSPRTGRAARYRYDRPGTYRVTQIVWDTNGRAARVSREITVSPEG